MHAHVPVHELRDIHIHRHAAKHICIRLLHLFLFHPDPEQGAFYMDGDKKRAAFHQLFIVQVASMYPWRCTVPSTHFLWRRYSHTAKKRMEGARLISLIFLSKISSDKNPAWPMALYPYGMASCMESKYTSNMSPGSAPST